MKIVLYEKGREEDDSMFRPVSNERFVWLIDLISHIERDKEVAKIRIEVLLSGKKLNTELSSFILKILEN